MHFKRSHIQCNKEAQYTVSKYAYCLTVLLKVLYRIQSIVYTTLKAIPWCLDYRQLTVLYKSDMQCLKCLTCMCSKFFISRPLMVFVFPFCGMLINCLLIL